MSFTDRIVRVPPALPSLGAAGYTFTDPTFGSRMGRITDGAFTADLGGSPRSFFTASAGYTQEWNADGTKFYVISGDGNHWLCNFNRQTMVATRVGNVPLPFQRETAHWDSSDPNVLYGPGVYANGHTIVKVNVTNYPWTTTVLLDLDTIVGGLNSPDPTYTSALCVCNGVLMVTFGGTGAEYTHYILHWPLPSGAGYQLVDTLTRNGMDEFNTKFSMHSGVMDKSGRYINVVPTGSVVQGRPVAPYHNYFWDTLTNTMYPCRTHSGGHETLGWNARCNADSIDNYDAVQWIITPDLSAVESNRFEVVIPIGNPQEIYAAEHSSWNNATAGPRKPLVSAIYRVYDGPNNIPPEPHNDTPWRAWDNEVVMFDTTGPGGAITRYCHTRSQIWPELGTYPFDFFYTPRANIDVQGQFALFTSNWEKTLGTDPAVGNMRTDVFVVELLNIVPTPASDRRVKSPHSRHRFGNIR